MSKRQQNCTSKWASTICSLWKLFKCPLHQIAREIILFPVNSIPEKTAQKVEKDEILKACARSNLHMCYNFALVLHENALVFSQSEARNFFMYIINHKDLVKKSYKLFLKKHKQICKRKNIISFTVCVLVIIYACDVVCVTDIKASLNYNLTMS